MQPPPAGIWGMSPELLKTVPGYDPHVQKNQIIEKLGYGPEKRRKLVWEIDKKLQEDGARPIIYHFRAATCWQPKVKGLTVMVNSRYNGWRFEDLWLDD